MMMNSTQLAVISLAVLMSCMLGCDLGACVSWGFIPLQYVGKMMYSSLNWSSYGGLSCEGATKCIHAHDSSLVTGHVVGPRKYHLKQAGNVSADLF